MSGHPLQPSDIRWITPPSTSPTVPEQGYLASFTVPNRVESVRPAAAFIVQIAHGLKIPVASQPLFEVAVAEALANAVKHGHAGTPDATVTCEVEVKDRQLTVRVVDGGRGFTVPDRALPPVDPSLLDSLQDRGYGLPIIQSVFEDVRAIRVQGRFGIEMSVSY